MTRSFVLVDEEVGKFQIKAGHHRLARETPFKFYLRIMLSLQCVLSVPCNLVLACWERADILTRLCVMFSCVFFPPSYMVFRISYGT